jgi:hypothetical protein
MILSTYLTYNFEEQFSALLLTVFAFQLYYNWWLRYVNVLLHGGHKVELNLNIRIVGNTRKCKA